MNFDKNRKEQLKKNRENLKLQDSADIFFEESVKARYSYAFDWLGLPIIQYPQDIVTLQEIIQRGKPNTIIETGFARGGSAALMASILSLINDDDYKLITVEKDFNKEYLERMKKTKFNKHIKYYEGSSIDKRIFNEVCSEIGTNSRVMIVLDSMHTKEHVQKEIELYANLVSIGCFICIMDTAIGYLPGEMSEGRPWDPKNSPLQAAMEFIEKTDNFRHAIEYDDKNIISVAKYGYLERIK